MFRKVCFELGGSITTNKYTCPITNGTTCVTKKVAIDGINIIAYTIIVPINMDTLVDIHVV